MLTDDEKGHLRKLGSDKATQILVSFRSQRTRIKRFYKDDYNPKLRTYEESKIQTTAMLDSMYKTGLMSKDAMMAFTVGFIATILINTHAPEQIMDALHAEMGGERPE